MDWQVGNDLADYVVELRLDILMLLYIKTIIQRGDPTHRHAQQDLICESGKG